MSSALLAWRLTINKPIENNYGQSRHKGKTWLFVRKLIYIVSNRREPWFICKRNMDILHADAYGIQIWRAKTNNLHGSEGLSKTVGRLQSACLSLSLSLSSLNTKKISRYRWFFIQFKILFAFNQSQASASLKLMHAVIAEKCHTFKSDSFEI